MSGRIAKVEVTKDVSYAFGVCMGINIYYEEDPKQPWHNPKLPMRLDGEGTWTHVRPPHWLEKLRGITWEDKVAKAEAKLMKFATRYMNQTNAMVDRWIN